MKKVMGIISTIIKYIFIALVTVFYAIQAILGIIFGLAHFIVGSLLVWWLISYFIHR